MIKKLKKTAYRFFAKRWANNGFYPVVSLEWALLMHFGELPSFGDRYRIIGGIYRRQGGEYYTVPLLSSAAIKQAAAEGIVLVVLK